MLLTSHSWDLVLLVEVMKHFRAHDSLLQDTRWEEHSSY